MRDEEHTQGRRYLSETHKDQREPTGAGSTSTVSHRRVEADEWPVLLLSAGFAFGSVALAIFIRTWSDTLFLTRFQAEDIAIFYIWSALIFAPTTMGYAWLSQRFEPVKLNTSTLFGFAGVASLCLSPPSSDVGVFVLLLVLSLVSPLVNAICWGLILERLNSRQSKRLIPLIGGSATMGAAVSGVIGAEVIEWGGDRALVWLIISTLIALSPLPRLLLNGVDDRSLIREAKDTPERLIVGLKALGKNQLLKVSAIATFLMAIATNLIDFLFKAELQSSLEPEMLGPFFARFHAFTNVGILFVQLLVMRPALERLGPRWSFGLYPLSLLALISLCLGPVGLWAFIGLRGVDTLMKFTFYSTTENMLLTPVPFRERTQSKVFLKGVVYPLGGLVAGTLITLTGLLLGSNAEVNAVLIITLGVAVGWLWSTSRVHRHYLQQLASNLGVTLEAVQVSRQERLKGLDQLEALKLDATQWDQERIEPLLAQIAGGLHRPRLSTQLTSLWPDLDESKRMDLIELLDELARRDGVKGLGDLLEELVKRSR